ncbi:MAG: pyridoxamine 5'-phosphate oxidase [Bacteroidia bacterium]|nr:pyridoxamine 5'-phosphate oxidase [Bacteroidia bacterium]
MEELPNLRKDYTKDFIDENLLAENPLTEFEKWFKKALESNQAEPNAMSLATVSPEGQPSVRIVLLKGLQPEGFVFFSNYLSRKGKELENNPLASLNFFWPALEQQIRIEGKVTKIPHEESNVYFQSRDRGSRLGAWASPQSQKIQNREFLLERIQAIKKQFENQEIFPKPEFWGGYLLIPHTIEFWQGRESRLHDRILYEKAGENVWTKSRLAP